MRARELFELLDHAGDGAFVTDAKGRIVYWGPSATRLLGHSKQACEGKRCWEALGCGDCSNTSTCCPDCRLLAAAVTQRPTGAADLRLRTVDQPRWFSVSILGCPVEGYAEPLAVHLCRDIERPKRLSRLVGQGVTTLREVVDMFADHKPATPKLTPREVEILRLCARGLSSKRIADELYISPTTVRNHVQNILEKLECHSRVEAVLRARESGGL